MKQCGGGVGRGSGRGGEEDIDPKRAKFVDGSLDATVLVLEGLQTRALNLDFWWRGVERSCLEELMSRFVEGGSEVGRVEGRQGIKGVVRGGGGIGEGGVGVQVWQGYRRVEYSQRRNMKGRMVTTTRKAARKITR